MDNMCQALFRRKPRKLPHWVQCPIGHGTALHRAPSGSGCPGPFVQPSRNTGFWCPIGSMFPLKWVAVTKSPFPRPLKIFFRLYTQWVIFFDFSKIHPRAKRAVCHQAPSTQHPAPSTHWAMKLFSHRRLTPVYPMGNLAKQ